MKRRGRSAAAFLGVWLASTPAFAVQAAKAPTDEAAASQGEHRARRLYLKDGSYEPIRSYQVKGAYVRYLSAERGEWEEVPYSFVDWAATERFARDSAADSDARRKAAEESSARERAEAEAASPVVAPGLRLPERGGVYLLDTFNGKPELNAMRQNGADLNKNTAGNILRGVINPIAGSRQTVELKGAHAELQAHMGTPVIYVSVGGGPDADFTAETASGRFRIVRCEERKGNRIVGALNIAVTGRVSDRAKYIETRTEPVSDRWIRVTPRDPLPRGEYALVEVLGPKSINMYVWDFGVNASAPANTNLVTPQGRKADGPPELLPRKDRTQPKGSRNNNFTFCCRLPWRPREA